MKSSLWVSSNGDAFLLVKLSIQIQLDSPWIPSLTLVRNLLQIHTILQPMVPGERDLKA